MSQTAKIDKTHNEAVYTLHDIRDKVGTVTDISMLCKVDPDVIRYGPELTDKDLNVIKQATEKRLHCGTERTRIDFHKDGKKILSFATAYLKRRNDLWADFFEQGKTESDWMLAKMVLSWFVECTEKEVKQKCVDWLNSDLRESDWQMIRDNGAGFLKNYPEMQETTPEEKQALARAFKEVRDDIPVHLTRFWLELFERHGVEDAVKWIRDNWKPLSEETKDQINTAYKAAKQKLKEQ